VSNTPDWAASSGDVWAERWRETDQALSGLAPALYSAILEAAPVRPFAAFDVGCGPGSTTLELARARADASIIACDLSPSLAQVARERLAGFANVQVVLGDAQAVALERGPFDLIYSRHGVMFFADPVAAFANLRRAATDCARLVFSCFQSWDANPWACELASAAAGHPLPPPGREPSGFAFAEPDYVAGLLAAAGWTRATPQPVEFPYVAAEGEGGVKQAMSFLSAIGPAARTIESLAEEDRAKALQRMREVVERRCEGRRVEFEAAAWIWRAAAA
jgi:SAM-dependent methyltransferase